MLKNEITVKDICVCIQYNKYKQHSYIERTATVSGHRSIDRLDPKITRAKRKSQARRVAMQCMRYDAILIFLSLEPRAQNSGKAEREREKSIAEVARSVMRLYFSRPRRGKRETGNNVFQR